MVHSRQTAVREIIRKADVVLEVLDARLPELTRNTTLERYAAAHRKPLVPVINKIDIVSPALRAVIRSRYPEAMLTSATAAEGIPRLVAAVRSRSGNERIKVAFIGYPNTGKSSLLNLLSRGGRSKTSPEAGFTKGPRRLAGKKGLLLFDTPGVVPIDAHDEIRLGLVAAISPAKLKSPDLVAYELLSLLQKSNPAAISERYGADATLPVDELLTDIAKKKYLFSQGKVPDERRAALQLLNDWHAGKIRI